MNLLTIIVIIIFALFILRGYQRGFIKSLASMGSLILSIILVNIATPYVTEFLKTQTPVYSYILEKCEDTFSVDTSSTVKGSDTGEQDSVIDSLPLPETLKDFLKKNNTPEYYRMLAANSFADYVQKYMAELILNICSYVVTLVLVISFIGLAVATLDLVAKLPLLHGLNQILGLGIGFAQGLIIVWVGFLIITIFSQTYAGRELMQMIVDSPILSKIYDTNVLLDFLQNTLQKIF